jgi:hypothetical protein
MLPAQAEYQAKAESLLSEHEQALAARRRHRRPSNKFVFFRKELQRHKEHPALKVGWAGLGWAGLGWAGLGWVRRGKIKLL